jgi:hypothetical protein
MKWLAKRKKKINIDKLLDDHLEVLLQDAKTDTDIEKILILMERHDRLRKNKHKQIDPNVIITAVVTLINGVGITLLILNYEKIGIITSKAFSQVGRWRA